jgi:pimeloyl-ACP methyl ester carboxylesterase
LPVKKNDRTILGMATLRALGAALRVSLVRTACVVAPARVERLLLDRFFTPARRPLAQTPDVLGEEWSIISGRESVSVYTAGTGPRVLLVHGWEGDATDFSSMSASLQSMGYGVVTFDQPAHGKSTGRQTTLPAMSRAVLDVARAAGPFVAAVGHSLGGSATLLALRDGLPARCAVLIAPPYDARHFVNLFGKHIGLTKARIAGAIARIERTIGAVGGRETDRAAGGLRVPGLVMHDRADRSVPFLHGVAVAAAWPGARFVPLEGLGHRRVLDAEAVHQEVLSFIQQSIAGQPSAPNHARRFYTVRETSL